MDWALVRSRVMTVIGRGLANRACDKEVSRISEPIVSSITGGKAHEPLHV